MPIAIVAFVFSMGTIYGAGAQAGMWSLMLLLLAAPVWIFLQRQPQAPGGTASAPDQE
jgi:basic amino acid/polyamine antiporter, APA family